MGSLCFLDCVAVGGGSCWWPWVALGVLVGSDCLCCCGFQLPSLQRSFRFWLEVEDEKVYGNCILLKKILGFQK